jgi:hypothetical protein
MNKFLAYFFYYLGDLSWKLVILTDQSSITRKLISMPCWAMYQKFMTVSLDYDEKAGYILWKESKDNE